MAVTIHDVARHAGVSISTVSRVLNNTCRVHHEKRERVEAAVESLGYTPNPVARSLLRKRTGGVGVVLPHVGGEFFSEFLTGMDLQAQANDAFLLISTSHRNPKEMKLALQGMYRRVDGLVLMAPESGPDEVRALVPEGSPVLLVNTRTDHLPLDAIHFDNQAGAYLATSHLAALGHRRIAMLKGPEHAYDAQERLEGYRAALVDHGLTPSPALELPGDFTSQAGYAAAKTLLDLPDRPTAVFAANDQSAIALINGLHHAGIPVPEAVSVVGFDDIPSAQYTSPALTSIHVPIHTLGAQAIERLLAIIDAPHSPPQQQILAVSLVVRESTAPVPA